MSELNLRLEVERGDGFLRLYLLNETDQGTETLSTVEITEADLAHTLKTGESP